MFGTMRMFVAAALVALLVPAAALAADRGGGNGGNGGKDVSGPLTAIGAGFFGGELELEGGEGQRPVQVAARGAGYVGFLDLGGDLKVRCTGGRLSSKETDRGRAYLCQGKGVKALVLGSHVTFRGFAGRYRIQLPEGASGTLHGRFATCSEGRCGRAEAAAERQQRTDARAEKKAGKRAEKQAGKQQDAGKPTIAQVAAALAAAKG